MRKELNRSGATLLLLASIALGGAPAFAQTATSSTAAAPAPAAAATPQAQAPASKGVEEIVVTAQKREQLSQDVPIAITAFTAQTIQFRGIDDMSDLEMQVPGLQFGLDTGADQQIYIRGIGIDDASGSVEAPVATYVDGIYQTRTFRAPTLGIDVQRIEVLKGPQGTLFGRNATGGAVNILLAPPTDELSGTVKAGVGSYGQMLSQASVSGPLVKNVLDLRVSGAVSRDGGWIINAVNDRPVNDHLEGDGRVALAYHPAENLAIDYDLLLNKLVGGGVNGIATNIIVKPGLIPANDYINGNNPWKGKFAFPIQGDMENTQNAVTAKWDISPSVYLKSITGFQEHTVGNGTSWPAQGVAASLEDLRRQTWDQALTQEFNLGGTREINWWKTNQPFTWLAGAYYMHEDYSSWYNPVIVNLKATKINLGAREKLDDYSTFGDITIPLPFNLSLFGGVRYTYDKKDTNQTESIQVSERTAPPFGKPYTPPLNIPGATCYGIRTTQDFHNVSYRVGMGWAPNEALNFYVKYSTGYDAGGHYYDSCGDNYKSETIGTVEGGVKGRFFDGRLVFDFAGYWNDYKDYQIFVEVPSPIGTAVGIINAPEAETWGGEFSVTTIPFESIQNFKANLGLSIMHSQYDALIDENPATPGAPPQNLAGQQMQRSPNHTEKVGLEYDWDVPWNRLLGAQTAHMFDLGAFRVRGEWYHTDTVIFHPFGKVGQFGEDLDVQHPYSIFNVYATLPTEDGKWSARFFAKNFLAQKYFQYKVGGASNVFGVGGAPQWFGGDITYRF
jgi:iron complex outermembrane receptor protein